VRKLAAAMGISLVLVLLPAHAHADWSRARPMDEPGWTAASVVATAVARDGRALMAWVGWPPDPQVESQIRFRRVGATGRLGNVRTLDIGDGNTTPTQL
jgi:hypothetical protein